MNYFSVAFLYQLLLKFKSNLRFIGAEKSFCLGGFLLKAKIEFEHLLDNRLMKQIWQDFLDKNSILIFMELLDVQ